MNNSLSISKSNKFGCANAEANAGSSDYYQSEEEEDQVDIQPGDYWHVEREGNIITDDPIFRCGNSSGVNHIGDPDIPVQIASLDSTRPNETYQHRCLILEKGWQGSSSMPQFPGEGRARDKEMLDYFNRVKMNLRERSRISVSLAHIDNNNIDVMAYRDMILQTTDHRHDLECAYFQNKIEVYPAYGSLDNNSSKAIVQRYWGNSVMLRGTSFCEENNIVVTRVWPPHWEPNPRLEEANLLPDSLFTSKKACSIQGEWEYNAHITLLNRHFNREHIQQWVIELNNHRRHLSIPLWS